MPNSPISWQRKPAAAALSSPDVAADWDRLNRERGDLPFLSAAAVCHALAVFGAGEEALLSGLLNGKVVAMFVLAPQGRWRWQTFQPSQMPLGAWVALSELKLPQLAEGLVRAAALPSLVLSVTQVDSRYEPRGDDTARLTFHEYIDTGWIDVQGTFETYWAARGKNLRQNLRKQRNKLAAEGTSTEMRVLCDVADMAPALVRYGALESSGWKAGEGTAIHPDNAQGRFYRHLLEDGAARGEAAVYEYLLGGRTVAMNLCLKRAGQLIVLKTTYDESLKTLSPASMLREEELQSIFGGSEFQRIEYYGRLMDWHTKLTDNKRSIYHLTCFRWGWLRSLAARRKASTPAAETGLEPST